MSAWMIAALALLPPLAVSVVMCARGLMAQRMAAIQLANAIGTMLLIVLTFALDQSFSIDLALAFVLLGLPASLLLAVFAERWL